MISKLPLYLLGHVRFVKPAHGGAGMDGVDRGVAGLGWHQLDQLVGAVKSGRRRAGKLEYLALRDLPRHV